MGFGINSWSSGTIRRQVLEAHSVSDARKVELPKGHIVSCQGKRNRPLDPAAMLGDFLQTLVDRRVEVLLPTPFAHPGWHIIHIDRAAFEMKPGADYTLLHFASAQFAEIIGCHLYHLLSLFRVCRDDQQHTRR